ncbi:hypothetical protein [Nocardioides houyundeii]|uniref:hypothetical protein n=1 Tax=Nocardioides houyundeii TaxID=2045452 RepID=UPI00131511EA|nr:hypothetical protein [Nocardioides houyundeii]
MNIEQMWQDVATVGRVDGGGYRRQSFAAADLELRQWFAAAAAERGMSCEVDPFGNLSAWWRPAGLKAGRARRPRRLPGRRPGPRRHPGPARGLRCRAAALR